MHTRPQRLAVILLLPPLLAAVAACRATHAEPAQPAWSGNPAAGLDERVTLAGVGSARGNDAAAAGAARHAALAAVLEQLLARVEARTANEARETSLEQVDDGQLSSSVDSTELRERIVRVTSEADLPGAGFELARSAGAEGPLTWARAVFDRAALAEHILAPLRADLERARTATASAAALLARADVVPGEAARGLRDALDAQRALAAPRAALPLLVAIRPPPGSAAAADTALIGTLDKDLAARLADAALRISIRPIGEVRVGFVGQPAPVTLQALWNGVPLAGLALAACFGDGPAAQGFTDEAGRLTLSVPAPLDVVGHSLRVGPASDGAPGPLAVLLPVSFLRPSDARIALLSRHERVDAGGGPARSSRPSPLHADIEALLGRLRFAVVTVSASSGDNPQTPQQYAGAADYVLQVETRTSYSSAEGSAGPYWYRTAVDMRLTELSSGETVAASIAGRDTKAAGATPDQAAQRSLAAAMEALSRPDDPASLVGVLGARFR